MQVVKDKPFEDRLNISNTIRAKYPDRVPIIVSPSNSKMPPIVKQQFLSPADIPMGRFLSELRKHITLRPEQAIFLFCKTPDGKEIMCNSASIMSQVYYKYVHQDGFLYFVYATESTFG